MNKLGKIFFVIISCSIVGTLFQSVYAFENIPTKPEIIPRASWGANELYTDLNSVYWQNILKARENRVDTEDPEAKKKRIENYKKAVTYINENFLEENTSVEKLNYDPATGQRYAWPISYTKYVNAIVIHHTHDDYESSEEGIKQIYKYHSLNRQWGDIGYNYVIGYEGQIFEGRKGGEYVAGAHSRWNNYSTVGISIMGDYDHKGISKEQYNSLEELVRYLAWRYGIDLSKQYYYHRDCAAEKCDVFPIETLIGDTLVGHRDTGHTSCPGDTLYEQMNTIKRNNLEFTKGFSPIARETNKQPENNKPTYTTSQITLYSRVLKTYKNEELELLLRKVEDILQQEGITHERRKKLQVLRLAIVLNIKN